MEDQTTKIYRIYKGIRYDALWNTSTGLIDYQGVIHPNISGVNQAITGGPPSGGWDKWRYNHNDQIIRPRGTPRVRKQKQAKHTVSFSQQLRDTAANLISIADKYENVEALIDLNNEIMK